MNRKILSYTINRNIRHILRKFGYDVVRLHQNEIGKDPFTDMAKFLKKNQPIVFDVGANIGQTIHKFRSQFPKCIIHSFEPSPTTFEILYQQTSNLKDVHLWNFGIGSTSEQLTFLENSQSDMSSFLPLDEFGWGKITKETLVEVKTIDQFCHEENIEKIDILKSDTQGFELEVFKGAEQTIRENKIRLIYFEAIFSKQYKDLPSFAQIYDFLNRRNFLLVSFYEFRYQKQLASWTDALFVQKSFLS